MEVIIGFWVLKYKDIGYYVAIDSASGGYPYKIEFKNCHRFKTLESAEKYSKGEFEIIFVKQTNVLQFVKMG